MAKYRKKPVVIEAEQFDHEAQPWPLGVIPWYKTSLWYGIKPEDGSFGYIETLEGRMHVHQDDWIITGVMGEKYPCKDNIFSLTYEKVDESGPTFSLTYV